MLIEFFPNGAIDETSSTRRISFFFVVEVTRELYTLEGCALTVHLTNSCIYYLIIRRTTRSFYFILFVFFFLSAIECEASTRAALGLADWNATVHSDTLFQVGNEVCKVIYAHNCYQSCTFHITRGSSKKVLL